MYKKKKISSVKWGWAARWDKKWIGVIVILQSPAAVLVFSSVPIMPKFMEILGSFTAGNFPPDSDFTIQYVVTKIVFPLYTLSTDRISRNGVYLHAPSVCSPSCFFRSQAIAPESWFHLLTTTNRFPSIPVNHIYSGNCAWCPPTFRVVYATWIWLKCFLISVGHVCF